MKLADGLARAGRRELERLAQACRLPLPLPGAAQIAQILTDPERVRRTVAELGEAEELALKIVAVGCHWEAGSEAVGHFLKSTGHGKADKAFPALADLGLLLPASATGGRYVVPDDLRPLLLPWLKDELRRAGVHPEPPPVPPPCPEAPQVVADLARLLGRLQGTAGVAGGGHVYKRDQQSLLAWLGAQPGDPPPWPWDGPDAQRARSAALVGLVGADAAWQGFAPRLGLLLSLAAGFELIREERTPGPGSGNRRWTAAGGAAAWCALDPWVQWWAMFHAWLHLLDHVHPALRLLVEAAAGDGPTLAGRAAAWWDRYSPGGNDPLRLLGVPFLLHTGWTLGALQVGGAGEEAFITCTPPARAALRSPDEPPADWPAWDERFYVQADFELIAPPYLQPQVLRRLATLCEPVRVDRATVLRLSPGPVAGAALAGDSADAVVAFLEAGAAAGVPQNVAFTLRQWCGFHHRLALEPALLLRLDDDAVGDRIRSLAAVRKLVREEITPSVWRFDAAAGPRLWDLLREAGCEPRGDRTDLQPRGERREGSAGPRYSRVNLPWPGPDAYTPRFSIPDGPPGGAERGTAEAAAAQMRAPASPPAAAEPEAAGEDWQPSVEFSGPPDIPNLSKAELRRLIARAAEGEYAVLLRSTDGDVSQFDPGGIYGDWIFGYCHACEDFHDLSLTDVRGARLTSLKFRLPDDLLGDLPDDL